ncbi:MAG TPA: response regulator, partial [Pseudoxanthomonas mexicana]|nr:response regulator [Pseudoxanthomonas mexicana]
MNSAPGTMPSILLVEDDRISAAFLSAALATLPARVHVAEDCAQALAASGPFDAWLIDANLPDGSGTWLLQRLRETDATASALAHTADATVAT